MANKAEFTDIQALVRFGHGHLTEACFLLLKIVDPCAAKTWLRQAPVSDAQVKAILPDSALQIAFTAQGLSNLKLDKALIEAFSEEFVQGMNEDESRSRRLGDIDSNAAEVWNWGGKVQTVPDVLVMIYAREGELVELQTKWQDASFHKGFQLLQLLDTTDTGGLEPFGFADGISQPELDWEQTLKTDFHSREAYVNQVALGEVLLGYANEYGKYTKRPLISVNQSGSSILPCAEEQPEMADLGRNGSYLVFRQLHQDVAGFWQYMDKQASGDKAVREQIAEIMVGRKRDGTPLIDSNTSPMHHRQCNSLHNSQNSSQQNNQHSSDDTHQMLSEPNRAGVSQTTTNKPDNRFNYDSDPHGQQCPIGAHIRRSNPRTGDFPAGVRGWFQRLVRIFGFGRQYPGDDLIASTRFHRLLRRGRPYGEQITPEHSLTLSADKTERGLHFVCLVANIARQFEFVQNAWSIGPKFAGLQNEGDPLLGNREPLTNGESTDSFTQATSAGPAKCYRHLPQFISVRGGAYFFMPGIRALQYIARDTSSTNEDGE